MLRYKNLLITYFSFERKLVFFDAPFNFLYQKAKNNKIFALRQFRFLSFWLFFLFFNNNKNQPLQFNCTGLYDHFVLNRFLLLTKKTTLRGLRFNNQYKPVFKNLFLWFFIHKNLQRHQKVCQLLLRNFSKIRYNVKPKFVLKDTRRSMNVTKKIKNYCFFQQQKTKVVFWFQLLKQIFANNIFTKFFKFVFQTEKYFLMSQSSRNLVSNLIDSSFSEQQTGKINSKRIFDLEDGLSSIMKADYKFRKALSKRILKENNVKFLRKKNWRLPSDLAKYIPSKHRRFSTDYVYWFTKKFFKRYLLKISKLSLDAQRQFKFLRKFKLKIPKPMPVSKKKAVKVRNPKLFATLSKKFAYEDSVKLLVYYSTIVFKDEKRKKKRVKNLRLTTFNFYRSVLFLKYLRRKFLLKFFRYIFCYRMLFKNRRRRSEPRFKNKKMIKRVKKSRKKLRVLNFLQRGWGWKKRRPFQYYRIPRWKKNKEIKQLVWENQRQLKPVIFSRTQSIFNLFVNFFGVKSVNLSARIQNLFHLIPVLNRKLFSRFLRKKNKRLFKEYKAEFLSSVLGKDLRKKYLDLKRKRRQRFLFYRLTRGFKKNSIKRFKNVKRKNVNRKNVNRKNLNRKNLNRKRKHVLKCKGLNRKNCKSVIRKRKQRRKLKPNLKRRNPKYVKPVSLFNNLRLARFFLRIRRYTFLLRRIPFMTVSYDFYPNVTYGFVEKLPRIKSLFFTKNSFFNFFLRSKDLASQVLYNKMLNLLGSTNSFLLSNVSFLFSSGSVNLFNLQPRLVWIENKKPLFYCFQSLCFLSLMVKKNIAQSMQRQSFLSWFKFQNLPGKIVISTRTNSIFLTIVDPSGVTLLQTTTGSLSKKYRPRRRKMRIGFKRRREIRKTQFKKFLKEIKRAKREKTKTEEQKRMFLSQMKRLGGKRKKRKLLGTPNRRYISFKTIYPIFFILEYFLSRFKNANSKKKGLFALERLKLKLQNKLSKLRKLKKMKTKTYKQMMSQMREVKKKLKKKRRTSFLNYSKPLLKPKMLFSPFSLSKLKKKDRLSVFSNLVLKLEKMVRPRLKFRFLEKMRKKSMPTRKPRYRRIFQRFIPFFWKFKQQKLYALQFFRYKRNRGILGFKKFNFYKVFRKHMFFFKKMSDSMLRRQFLSFIVILKNFEQKTCQFVFLKALKRLLTKFLAARKKMVKFIMPHCYSLLFLQQNNIKL